MGWGYESSLLEVTVCPHSIKFGMMLATSTATKPKTEASVTEGPTVVDTSESVRCKLFLQNFARLVDAVRPVVVKFAVNALSKSLISEYNKCDAENLAVSEFNRASVLMSQILPKIKDSDAHFDTFVAILQELNITKLACELKKAVDPTPITASRTRGDSDSGSTSGTESVDVCGFQCPCGQCSLEKYFRDRSKCPGLQETAFPYLDTSHLSRDERKTLEHQLIADTSKIKREFKKFSDAVFKALERNETPVRNIKSTVFSCAGAGLSKAIQMSHGDKLETITTVPDLKSFLIRYKYISFINYGILEEIIDEHCKECKTDLDNYLQKFKDFSRRNVFEVPSDIFPSSSTPDNLLVVKVIDEIWFGADRETPDCPFTIWDITSIQNKIAEVFGPGHDRGFIDLVDVGKGCIQLAFEVLSCQKSPIFPLTTSQLSELIRCGIIVLYQPNLPSLPTNIQDTDCQTHDIQSTDADDSETPPTIPSADDSETPPTIPSADDTETPPTIPSADDSETPPTIPSADDSETPPTIPSADDSKTPPTIPSAPVLSTVKPLPSQFTNDDSRGMISADSSSIASPSEVLQEPRKWNMSTGLSLRMEELEERIAEKKRLIEEWRQVKAIDQLFQREAEEEVRVLQSRLAQILDPAEWIQLERKIQDEEETIKENEKMVQRYEEWINQAESSLQSLYETKNISLLDSTQELPLIHVTKPSIGPRTPLSYQSFITAVVKPSSEQSQHQTLSGKKELPLTMKPLERRIAEKKDDIEYFKRHKADWQQELRKAEERVRVLQSRLAQTTDEDDRRELERKIHDGEERIKWCKERVQRCEEWISEQESNLLSLYETKDKESKKLLDLGMTSPSVQTDTLLVKSSQKVPLTKPSIGPMTRPSYQPVTVAAVKPTVPSVKPIPSVTRRTLPSQFTDDSRSMISSDSGYSGSTASSSEVLQEPRKWNMSTGLSLTMEELEERIAEKKRDIEFYKYHKAVWQQEQRKAEKEVRRLESRLARTSDEDDQRELERKIHDAEMRIKMCKELVQQFEERINEAEADLLALTEIKVKEQSQHLTLSGKKELPLTMKLLERRIARAKRWIEVWKGDKADWQQRQRKAEERVRVLQSRLAQTTDEDDQRELERKIHDEEEMIKVWKERLQLCEERINEAESDILALTETKDKESKRHLDPGITTPSLQNDTSRLKSSQELPFKHGTKPSRRPMTSPSYQPVTVAAVKPTVPSGYSQHQTSIKLPPILETKVDTVTLEDDACFI